MTDHVKASILTYPHPVLNPVLGTPNNASIQVLQKQLYANAKAIDSTRGGGQDGHLALVMSPAAYLIRTGVAFAAPAHPGDAPIHAVGATTAQITETNRRFKHELADHRLFRTVSEEMKQQILLAVPNRYYCRLENVDFGYADVTVYDIFNHLKLNYAIIEPEEIEQNRLQLTNAWNPDEPIEDLWHRIQEIQRFAQAAQEAITDAAALRLTLGVFEATGVFTTATEKWRDKPQIEWTMPTFQEHFAKANKERVRKLTAQTAGYHGAHSAVVVPPAGANAITAGATPPSTAPPGNNSYHYCWTHGLGKNRLHTSALCNNKAEGHKDAATAINMMGGSTRIMQRRRVPHTAAPTTSP
jgi:hypothetical protein